MIFSKPPPPAPQHGALRSLERKPVLAWDEVLRECGYPTEAVVWDFETYFDETYGMQELSTVEYIQDSRFEILGLAETHSSDYRNWAVFYTTAAVVADHIANMQRMYGRDLSGCTIIMQKACFDASVLAWRFDLHPKYIVDTLCLARAWNARQKHGLDTLTKQFGLPEKGDTQEFKGLSFRRRYRIPKGRGSKMPVPRELITPGQVLALGGYAQNDAMRTFELAMILLPRLSNPHTELRLQDHTLRCFTRPKVRVDGIGANALVTQMQDEMAALVSKTGLEQTDISGNISFDAAMFAALTEAGDIPDRYCKTMKAGRVFAIAKDDPERELLEKHASEKVRDLMAARITVKSSPLHIARVEGILKQAACCGNWLPVFLKYYGAHTGRWAGGEGLNLQNLPKAGLLAMVRQLIVAPDGQSLIIVDAASIEARVLAWIAGQEDLVAMFATGADIYSEFASAFYHVRVRKPRENGIPAIEKLMKARRQFGKVCILGMGYGMGADKFADYADTDVETATRAVQTYRELYSTIVKFWRDLEKAFVYTATYHRSCELPRGLRFDSTADCNVIITLPNGRELHYLEVRTEEGMYGRNVAKVWNGLEQTFEHIWGGTLAENVVQAISRDVLGECLLRCEDRGLPIAFSVHDEVVGVVGDFQAESALNIACEEMSRTPSWAPGLPLGAEGCISKGYKK